MKAELCAATAMGLSRFGASENGAAHLAGVDAQRFDRRQDLFTLRATGPDDEYDVVDEFGERLHVFVLQDGAAVDDDEIELVRHLVQLLRNILRLGIPASRKGSIAEGQKIQAGLRVDEEDRQRPRASFDQVK